MASINMLNEYRTIQRGLVKLGGGRKYGGYELISNLQNVVLSLNSITLLEEYSDLKLIAFLIRTIVKSKHGINKMAKRQQEIFNRTLYMVLTVL